MRDLKGKVVVVTGAASGIGAAMAHAFAAEGSQLVIADIEADALKSVEQQLRASGTNMIAVTTDVADGASVARLAAAALDAFGAVHVLCNNAGVAHALRPVWEFSEAYWQWLLGVNVWGVIHSIRTFIPIMLRQGSEGHVVNTASLAGLLSYPLQYMGMYCASKHAVLSISETLAADLAATGSKIGVSVLCPGFVRTRIMESERHRPADLASERHADAALAEWWKAGVEGGSDPKDIAAAVLAAIRENRLYVLPHSDFNDAIRSHAEDLVMQRNPGANAAVATGA